MKNNNFVGMNDSGKRTKLKYVLKSRTDGYLTDVELETVINSVKLSRQYAIKLYFDANEFEKQLTLPKMCTGEVILGLAILGTKGEQGKLLDKTQPAVVLRFVRKSSLEHQILIFIPEGRKKMEQKSEQAMVLCNGECVGEKIICDHIIYTEKMLYCDLQYQEDKNGK